MNILNIEGDKIKNKIKIPNLEIITLVAMMAIIWINTDLWSRSFWINETDTLSFSTFGIEGFGFGFGPLIYIYYLIISVFGELDYVLRASSLFFSIITMITINLICRELRSGKLLGFCSSIIFIFSSYSIEYGLQIRSYAFNTMCVTLICLWGINKLNNPKKDESWSNNFMTLLICFFIWPPSTHYFSNIYLFIFFSSIILLSSYKNIIKEYREIIESSLFPPLATLFLITAIKISGMMNAIINSINGENYVGGGESNIMIISTYDFLFTISSQSNIILFFFLTGLTLFLHKSLTEKNQREKIFFAVLIINFVVPISLSLILQYKLSGFNLLRYLYFWFPIFCIISGFGISKIIERANMQIPMYNEENSILVRTIIIIFLFSIVSYEPLVNYGDIEGNIKFLKGEVGEEEVTIISSPPEHILQYYLNKYEINSTLHLGGWDKGDINLEDFFKINSDIIVVIGLQINYYWIFNFTETWLADNNYICASEESISLRGDITKICRK